MSDDLVEELQTAQAISLAQPLRPGIPCSPNHPGFQFSLIRRHGDSTRGDGLSAAAELIVTGGHVGTHIDALAHASYQGKLHGGIDAAETQRGGHMRRLGVDTITPFAGRGVMLDIPPLRGATRLRPAVPVGPRELEAAAERQGVTIAPDDAVLVRTGWGQLWDDPVAFLSHDGGVPGVTEAGANWLAARHVAIAGSDTTAFEQIGQGAGHDHLPVHRILLVEAGIPIIEMLNLEQLARLRASTFGLIIAPLPIVGGTGSPINPVALIRDDCGSLPG